MPSSLPGRQETEEVQNLRIHLLQKNIFFRFSFFIPFFRCREGAGFNMGNKQRFGCENLFLLFFSFGLFFSSPFVMPLFLFFCLFLFSLQDDQVKEIAAAADISPKRVKELHKKWLEFAGKVLFFEKRERKKEKKTCLFCVILVLCPTPRKKDSF